MAGLTERFEMRLDEDTLGELDNWRSRQSDVPSRAEAIRRLIDRGLVAEGSAQLRFSQGETMLIHLVCELLKPAKDREQVRVDFIQESLSRGHLWALQWDLPGLFLDQIDSEQVVTEVVDTLEMWEFIEEGYEKLDAKDKARVAKEAHPFGKNPKFYGFDGNNETRHMGIARFLVEQMDRFTMFRGRDFNSHMPSIDAYQRMLSAFTPIRSNLAGREMTASEIIAVLNERMHPSNRGAVE